MFVFDAAGEPLLAAILAGPEGQAGDGFGFAVAINSLGTIVVGAPNSGEAAGLAYVFDPPAGGWMLLARDGATLAHKLDTDATILKGSGEANAYFGSALAAWTADGTVPLVTVGEPGDVNGGTAYAFESVAGGGWTRFASFNSPDGGADGDGFGSAMAGVGTTLVVGAPTFGVGAAWVYDQSILNFTPLIPLGSTYGFGQSVTISADGNTVAVGAPNIDNPAVFGFVRSVSGWGQQGVATPSPSAQASSEWGSKVVCGLGASILIADPGKSTAADYALGAISYAPQLIGTLSLPFVLIGESDNGMLGYGLTSGNAIAAAGGPGFNGYEGEVVYALYEAH